MEKSMTMRIEEHASRIRTEEKDYFVTIEKEAALAQAKGGASGFLAAVDDNILMKDSLSAAGSKMMAQFKPPYGATVVDRLKAAGTVILGKTRVPELGIDGPLATSYRDPADSDTSGDTLYGGPAAVAAGYCDLALCADVCGNMGREAAKTGVSFIKPTYGMVSRFGLVAYASSMEQIGVVSGSVEGAFKGLASIAGYDKNDGTCYPEATYVYKADGTDLSGLKIGILGDFLPEGEEGGAEGINSFAEKLSTLGAPCEQAAFPLHQAVAPVGYIIASAEGSNNLSRFDGVKFGYRPAEYKGVDDLYVKTRTEGFGTEAKIGIMMGAYVLSKEQYEKYYMKAMQVRRLIRDALANLLKSYDCLLLPAGTALANLAGNPALSMAGGVQLIAGAFDENTLLRIGACVQAAGGSGKEGLK